MNAERNRKNNIAPAILSNINRSLKKIIRFVVLFREIKYSGGSTKNLVPENKVCALNINASTKVPPIRSFGVMQPTIQ